MPKRCRVPALPGDPGLSTSTICIPFCPCLAEIPQPRAEYHGICAWTRRKKKKKTVRDLYSLCVTALFGRDVHLRGTRVLQIEEAVLFLRPSEPNPRSHISPLASGDCHESQPKICSRRTRPKTGGKEAIGLLDICPWNRPPRAATVCRGDLPETHEESNGFLLHLFMVGTAPFASHLLSGWPKKSNFIFTTKIVFPKSLKSMNSGSEA